MTEADDKARSGDSSDEIEMMATCHHRIDSLLADLDDSEWSVRSLCPEWNVRDVVLHLAAIEHVLTGWRPGEGDGSLPFDQIGRFLAEFDGVDNEQVAARTAEVFAARSQDLATVGPDVLDTVGPTPVGPAPYRQFLKIRIFDFWVHHRDITTPLGRSSDDGGPTAEVALDQVHQSLGYIVGKKIGLPAGRSIRFDITGPVTRSMAVEVNDRARVVDTVTDPDVVVKADLLTFIQLACGRIDPATAIESGAIGWTGDDEWGRRAATQLRFTM